jgi:glycosyltransferase involved in cell wall biosynthesis
VTSSAPRRRLKKVVIVNTADLGGGAERVSMAVLDGFTALGIDTWLLVGDKRTDHPRVLPFYLSPFFDYRPYDNSFSQAALQFRHRAARWLGLEDFNYPYAHHIQELTGSPPDLVLCHNLHGGYFDIRALPALSRRVPIILQLFDTWLMTGHCASALGCPRWQIGCGRCPDLTIPPAVARDLTRVNWWRKRRIFSDARLYVTAESQWMLDRAGRSLLAPAVAEWNLIRGGVDLDTFTPGSRLTARRELALASLGHVALFVANRGSQSLFKDFATVRLALAELGRRVPDMQLELLIAGADGPEERIAPGVVARPIGYVQSPDRLVNLYRAADVYVHAAVEEPFGLSVAEALACGTPVVTASSGGILEIVEHGRSALVVPPRDWVGLADAIGRLLADPSLAKMIGAAGADIARTRLDRQTMIRSLHDWCTDIHANWATAVEATNGNHATRIAGVRTGKGR